MLRGKSYTDVLFELRRMGLGLCRDGMDFQFFTRGECSLSSTGSDHMFFLLRAKCALVGEHAH